VLWIAAFVVTVMLAVFQRMTGPSYPVRGETELSSTQTISYRLPRSDQGRGSLEVGIPAPSSGATATLEWRRYPTEEPFQRLEMVPNGDGRVVATIPQQPPAGKVEYLIVVEGDAATSVTIPSTETVVARFRGSVPAGVLLPHILAMFASMLVSTRALFEVLRPSKPKSRGLILISMALLITGGLILGPIVQKYAFGAFWTGWPFGQDLTDNKTLIAFLAWLPATVIAARGLRTRAAVIIGWIVMTGIFLIPHSLRGSEHDWASSEVESAVIQE